MAYEKATLESFQAALKANKYGTLGGVRKAISKMSAFSEKEKEWARAMADKHFGASDGGAPAKKAPKSAKKIAKAKKAPKSKSAKRTAKASPGSDAPKKAASPRNVDHTRSPIATSTSVDDPATQRFAAASVMISALANRTRTPIEEKTYLFAHGEAQAVASDEGRRIAATFEEESEEPAVPPLVTAPTPPVVPVQPQYPRIQIPKVDPSTLSPEDRVQHEALEQAAKAAGIKAAGETKQTQVSS